MSVESSGSIKSPSSLDIDNEHSSKFHSFFKRDDTNSYRIWTRSEPASLTENTFDFERDWLDESLYFDLAWCLAANHSNDDEVEMPPFGSGTVLNSMATNKRTIQSNLNFFLVILYPPNKSVFKDYLDNSHWPQKWSWNW